MKVRIVLTALLLGIIMVTAGSATASSQTTAGAYHDMTRNIGGADSQFETIAQSDTFDCSAVTEIPQIECEALSALHSYTDGANWVDNDGWLSTNEPCNWFGVTCESGHVIQLGFFNNGLHGEIPPDLGNLIYLEHLGLGSNELSGSIPPELGNLTNLLGIGLQANQLSGSIPSEIGNLTNLTHISLQLNQLNGSIPPEIGNLTKLEWLDLYHNQLEGNLPSELGQLSLLRTIQINNNLLTGPIPPGLGNLSQLETLYLQDNQFSGPIPPELGSLDQLETLHLDGNQLSGSVPPELGSLSGLNRFYISENAALSGPLPQTLVNLTLNSFGYSYTGVCEPANLEFQNWLDSINSVGSTGVTTCPSNTISGRVTNNTGDPISHVAVDYGVGSVFTDNNGDYTITDMLTGTYTITPAKDGYTFSPSSRSVSIPPDATAQDFIGTPDSVIDTDGDGLPDEWEINGYDHDNDGAVDVDLPGMGADPMVKDIFVEIDYMEEGTCLPLTNICVIGHSHRPKTRAMQLVIDAFLDAPVANPDGSTGIRLHVDYGPESVMNPVTGERWWAFSQGNKLSHQDRLGTALQYTTLGWDDFDAIKEANFVEERTPIFHYAIFAHFLGGYECTSGISRGTPASDFIVSLGGWGSGPGKRCGDPGTEENTGTELQQAGTFMHELGHNLGLSHGGDDDVNYKPHYLSVMNYSYQKGGLIFDGKDGHIDYSAFALMSLDENNLDETAGLNIEPYGVKYWCGESYDDGHSDISSSSIDWNCDGSDASVNVQASINKDAKLETLTNHNDWSQLSFAGIGLHSSNPSGASSGDLTAVDELTEMEASFIPSLYDVAVTTSISTEFVKENSVIYTFTISNLGENADQYAIAADSTQKWADLSNVPTTISLAPGESSDIVITVSVPSSVNQNITDELKLSATSQVNPVLGDEAVVETTASSEINPYEVFLPSVVR